MKKINFLICLILSLSISSCEEPEEDVLLTEYFIETAGENCSDGGYKIISGLDLDYNSLLEESEIQETEYICNPTNPTFNSSRHILADYTVNSIVFVEDGVAWIGTYSNGLLKYDPNDKSPISSILPNIRIWDMDVDSQGNVWIASDGLIKYDGRKFTYFTTENSDIPEDIVWSIAIDSEDKIWIASNRSGLGGLATFDGSNWEIYTPENSALPVNMVHWIEIAENDNVWLSLSEKTSSPYLVKIAGDVWTVYSKEELGFTPNWLGKIQLNSKNELVCEIDDLGGSIDKTRPIVFIFNGQSSEQIQFANMWNIKSFSLDDEDNIWCYDRYGLAIHDGDSLFFYDDNFNDAEVFAIEQANDGKMWIGTTNGIYIINK
jgi:ligand-binding sensor domain-containing protein